MTTPAHIVMEAFGDELEKVAFLDKLREKIFGPKVRDDQPTPVLEDESKVRGAVGRLGAFLSGFMGAKKWENKSHGMIVFPGPARQQEQADAMNAVLQTIGDFPVDVTMKASGGSRYIPDENLIELVQGQLGAAYHEAGHVAGIEGMAPGLRDAYVKGVLTSNQFGPASGLALLPNALMDPPGRRRKLSKWGPAAAVVPSLPMLFEEARANIIGGRVAKQRGDLNTYVNSQIPSMAGYVAQAGAVPLGLYLIHRAKEKRLADAQAAMRAAVEEEMAGEDFPKAASAAFGFADEIEKVGGLKALLAAGAAGAALNQFGPGAIQSQIMSGAQNFNRGGPARYGGGHIAGQRGDFPLLEKIRFNPIVNAVGDSVGSGLKKVPGAVRTSHDFFSGGMGGPNWLSRRGT